MTRFGTIWLSPSFDDAVMEFADKWLDTYLSEVERLLDIPMRSYDRPRTWNVLDDPEAFPEDALPTILIVSGGLDESERVGGGRYQGWWNWSVIALVSARNESSTRKMAQVYGAALRAMFIQHPQMEGAAADTEFRGESYAGIAGVDGRSRNRHVVALEFRSLIETLAEESQGPSSPDAPAPVVPEHGDWIPVAETEVLITKQELPN